MNTTTSTVVIPLEHVLWMPGSEWTDAIEHVAGRFARVHPLDATTVLAHDGFDPQLAALAAWAEPTDVDLDRELGRFLDEHLAMHLRPDPAITRAIRAAAAHGPVHVATALGPRAGESLLRHAGCWRSVTELHPGTSAVEVVAAIPGAHAVSGIDQIGA